jgi:ABC-type nickel/cobalt efflux system permease component RcnA
MSVTPASGFWGGIANQGDVQGVIAVTLVVGFLALLVLSLWYTAPAAAALSAISAPFLVIMGFYFGSRVAQAAASSASPAA